MTQLRNDYAKGQKTYLETVPEDQSQLTAWEGGKAPVHGSIEGLSFANVGNDDDGDRGADGKVNAQASGRCAYCGGATGTRRCYYCKKEGHLKPDCLNLKAKRAAEKDEKATTGGTAKTDDATGGVGEHAHTMLVDKFQDFNNGVENRFFLSQVTEEKFSNPPLSWLLLDSKITIDIIANKKMVSKIKILETPITLRCNVGSQQVEYTSDLNRYERVWYDPKAIVNILSLSCATTKYRVVFGSKAVNLFKIMVLGREVVFNVLTNGLYYHDTMDRVTVLVNTVA